MLFLLAALFVWSVMPIYPDEIAFRMQLGRYIQDGGVVHGLYTLCESNIKGTPLLFLIPAWILSWVDLTFSPVEMRLFPFVTTVTAIMFAVWYAVRGINYYAAMLAITSLVGVAGSGLVLARYEYIHSLNLVCCLAVLNFHPSTTLTRPNVRYVLIILLLISCLFSLYVHIQGLLFLPLTLYLTYQLVRLDVSKSLAKVIMLILLALMALTGIRFHHTTCAGFPEIESFWANMTFNQRDLLSATLSDWFVDKLSKYLRSFLYNKNYAVDYLPGISIDNDWLQGMLNSLNLCIIFVLTTNLLLTACVPVIHAFLAIRWRYAPGYSLRVAEETSRRNCEQALVLVLFALPVIFLFIYDKAQNFYRSFFLNFVVAILLTLYFSRKVFVRAKGLVLLYYGLCGLVVLASLLVNAMWFMGKLQADYEGPSLSLGRDWRGIDGDALALVRDCGVDLTKGGIVVDDMTYNSLKYYPRISAITYVGLSATVIGSTIPSAIEQSRINAAITSCKTLHAVGIDAQHSRNLLCCADFSGVEK
ncbi:hypothetical protein F6R98_01065 [Candidatus Methylospira mobilis]|uniref:Glycosyltransferase RgtA/B/C/D-like domain-containing protein n=1 Tax=Candidatus Methylospira mobilis TaxID=1808979 RepID=A0A5Q0BHT3_9GAMM|nr:hypothetical protein [Candidatus Methylospira mobilis]QFY41386.1 hypothetical protein F6R98_01065 [Candidatus Methylospira mobilis]